MGASSDLLAIRTIVFATYEPNQKGKKSGIKYYATCVRLAQFFFLESVAPFVNVLFDKFEVVTQENR